MGSFFGSILPNLLPVGVGRSICKSNSPKIYVPNTSNDAEMHGYALSELIQSIVRMVEDDVLRELKEDDDDEKAVESTNEKSFVNPRDIVNYVLVDTENCSYGVPIDKENIKAMGIIVMDLPLVSAQSELKKCTGENPTIKLKSATLDPNKLTEVLITLGS